MKSQSNVLWSFVFVAPCNKPGSPLHFYVHRLLVSGILATTDATKVAQILTKHGYTKVKSIRTEQFVPNENVRGARFQIKLIIVLEKSADFDKLTEDIILHKEWLGWIIGLWSEILSIYIYMCIMTLKWKSKTSDLIKKGLLNLMLIFYKSIK